VLYFFASLGRFSKESCLYKICLRSLAPCFAR